MMRRVLRRAACAAVVVLLPSVAWASVEGAWLEGFNRSFPSDVLFVKARGAHAADGGRAAADHLHAVMAARHVAAA